MLTRKQYELLMFIHKRVQRDGVSPSFDEMKEALSLRSKSGIHRLITALEERGFIRRLPHRLVEALKATLEEAVQADFLLHVVDLSSPERMKHAETTLQVLQEIGAGDRPVITVLNKADLLADEAERAEALAAHPEMLPDRVHPNNEGAAEMAKAAAKAIAGK